MSEKMYIVKYSKGDYADFRIKNIFVTKFKGRAVIYVAKFNRTVKKWKKYYSQFEETEESGMDWIKDEHVEKHFNRWQPLREINRCWCEEIEIR